MMVNIPFALGAYPVTPVGSPLNPQLITSVVATLVAVVVTTDAHAPEEISEVPRADVPEAMVVVGPPAEPGAIASIVPTPAPGVIPAHVVRSASEAW